MATSSSCVSIFTAADLLDNDDIIKLNVGGYVYSTTRSTIVNNVDGESFLARLIRNQTAAPRNRHGEYFIDRDGKAFRYILNYLRERNLHLPDGFNEFKQLLCEANFYQIDRLRNELENRLNRSNECNAQAGRGLRFTLVSKFNRERAIVKLVAPLELVSLLYLRPVGKRLLKLISPYTAPKDILCQLTFPHGDQLIACHPFDQLQRFVLAKLARQMGLMVSYSDDYFYMPIERDIVSRDELAQLLVNHYNGRILHANITHDDSCTLVEHWLLSTSTEDTYATPSVTNVH